MASAASLPASSGNVLMDSVAHMGGSQTRGTAAAAMAAAQAAAAGSGGLSALLAGPELSSGLTPQVGALDLPPGIEAIVPSDQPLTGALGGWWWWQ